MTDATSNIVVFPTPSLTIAALQDGYAMARVVLRDIAGHPLTTVVSALDVLEHSTRRSDVALCRAARVEMAGLLSDEINRAGRRQAEASAIRAPGRRMRLLLGGIVISFVAIGLAVTLAQAPSVIRGSLAQAAAVRAAQ